MCIPQRRLSRKWKRKFPSPRTSSVFVIQSVYSMLYRSTNFISLIPVSLHLKNPVKPVYIYMLQRAGVLFLSLFVLPLSGWTGADQGENFNGLETINITEQPFPSYGLWFKDNLHPFSASNVKNHLRWLKWKMAASQADCRAFPCHSRAQAQAPNSCEKGGCCLCATQIPTDALYYTEVILTLFEALLWCMTLLDQCKEPSSMLIILILTPQTTLYLSTTSNLKCGLFH